MEGGGLISPNGHEEAPGSGCKPGLLSLGVFCEGTIPHGVNVLQLHRLQRVLSITVQCKQRQPKEKPREGTGSLGAIQGQAIRDLW
jgi:hypothetical protein